MNDTEIRLQLIDTEPRHSCLINSDDPHFNELKLSQFKWKQAKSTRPYLILFS